jgi:hypothetical protein
MAKYDAAFAELQAKLAAVLAVVEDNPDLASCLRDQLGVAEIPDVKGESPAYDEARANALSAELRNFDAALGVSQPEPEPEFEVLVEDDC